METLILYGQLFWQFFKTGLFAVGGGLATLPFLQEMSRLTHWFTTTDIADMVAVSESTPGPLGVNMATYVGFKTAGFAGGAIATLGLIAPSIIILLIINITVFWLIPHPLYIAGIRILQPYMFLGFVKRHKAFRRQNMIRTP